MSKIKTTPNALDYINNKQQIRNNKEWLDAVKTDAEQRGITVDEAVRGHATYTVDQKIYDGRMKLPETVSKSDDTP